MTEQATQAKEIQKDPRYHSCIEEILALIKGRAPLIWVLTHEETRFIADFVEQVAEPHKRKVWLWSAYQGLIPQEQQMTVARATGEEKDTHNPQKALQRIAEINKGGDGIKGHCFILRDFHTVLGEPVPRQIRDMYDHLIGNGKTLIITSPILAHGPGGGKGGLPPTLEKQISVVKYELPDAGKINARISEILEHMKESIKGKNKKTQLDYTGDDVQSFTKALQGLTMLEVDTSLSTSITHLNRLDVQKLINDKRQIIRKSQILEFIDAPVAMGDVGGLDLAKLYLSKYSKAYSDEAKEYGVEPLKGLLLTGVPGTGKSLLAKAIGKLWKVPLLRLDVGKVMTGLVGGSEEKMRQVVDQAEAMAPCVTGNTLITLANGKKITAEKLHAVLTEYKGGTDSGPIGLNKKSADIVTIQEDETRVLSKIHTVIRRKASDKKLLQITTESGKTIKVTENHKLLVKTATGLEWREARDLRKNDDLVELDSE